MTAIIILIIIMMTLQWSETTWTSARRVFRFQFKGFTTGAAESDSNNPKPPTAASHNLTSHPARSLIGQLCGGEKSKQV